MSRRSTPPSSGRCRRSHARSWLPVRGPGDEQVAVGRHAGDRQVALDPAAAVQQLGVDDRPTGASTSLAHIRLEERDGARPDDLELGERGLVEQAGRLPRGQRLRADRRRPVLARPAARPEGLVAERRRSTRTSSGAPSRTSRRTTRAERRRGPRRSARSEAAGRRGAPRSGSGCRSRSRSSRSTAPACTTWLPVGGPEAAGCPSSRGRARARRRRSRSPSGGRSRPRRRCRGRENPAATKKPRDLRSRRG